VPASAGRIEFYSGAERLSKSLAELPRLDPFLTRFVRDRIDPALNLLLLVLELLDLIAHGFMV
jgi:hypothetical protein